MLVFFRMLFVMKIVKWRYFNIKGGGSLVVTKLGNYWLRVKDRETLILPIEALLHTGGSNPLSATGNASP